MSKKRRIIVQGKEYVLCVGIVKSKNVLGNPRLIELMEEEQVIDLTNAKDNEYEFVTMFIPLSNFVDKI